MKTVVISGARTLFALRIARSLAAVGVRVVTVDSIAFATAGASTSCRRYVRSRSPKRETNLFYQDVQRILEEEQPDLWIPTYEEVFYLARARETVVPSIPLFAPSFEQLARVHDKARFAALADKLGAAPAETHLLQDEKALEAVRSRSGEFVFKPVWSRGGERVLIQPEPGQLNSLRPTPTDPWIAQTYAPGEEICTFGIAHRGRLLAHAAYRPYHRPAVGPAIAFQQVDGAKTRAFAEAFVEATAWHGQFGFDFRHDVTGKLVAIECNPRATSGIHFVSKTGLAAAYDGKAATDDETASRLSYIGLAMFTYGLAPALARGGLGQLWREWLQGRDVIWKFTDPTPALYQFPFTAEIGQLARRRKISMHAAFTDDMEWDGNALG